MKIVRLRISNFRCVRSAEILPSKHNVYLGPNNSGKTAIMEALNLLLNPEGGYRSNIIDANDFYCRRYIAPPSPPASTQTEQPNEDPEASPAQAADSSTELNSNQEETTPSPSKTVSTVDQPAIQSPDPENPRIQIEAVIASLNQEDEDVFKTELVPWRADTVSVIEEAVEGSDPFSGAEAAISGCF